MKFNSNRTVRVICETMVITDDIYQSFLDGLRKIDKNFYKIITSIESNNISVVVKVKEVKEPAPRKPRER